MPAGVTDTTIGIDVGGTKCLGVVLDARNTIVDEHRVLTPATGDALVAALTGLVRTLHLRSGTPPCPIGIGAPGLVDRGGVLRFTPNLPGIVELPLQSALEAADLGGAVVVGNDATCATWAEATLGAAVGASDVVLATIGTGIGGGVMLGGRLIGGHHGFAGEIGHMVVQAKGAACQCGGYGCWERYASGGGLGRLTHDAAREGRLPKLVADKGGDVDAVRAEDVSDAAASGLDEAVELMREIGWWLALGLSNLAAILDCGHFVIGGGLSGASDLVLPSAREFLADLVEGYDARPTITVTASMFGPRSGAMGAALDAFERLG